MPRVQGDVRRKRASSRLFLQSTKYGHSYLYGSTLLAMPIQLVHELLVALVLSRQCCQYPRTARSSLHSQAWLPPSAA